MKCCAGLLIASLAIPLAACGTCSRPAEPSGAPDSPAPPQPTATLKGQVVLRAGEALPAYERALIYPADNHAPPAECPPPVPDDLRPVRLSAHRGLEGVAVALTDFSADAPHDVVVHPVTISACRLSPRLVVATADDVIRLTNETDFPFLPSLGSSTGGAPAAGVLRALLPNRSRDFSPIAGRKQALTCGMIGPCGRTDVLTFHHSRHTITDEEGRFRLEDVPAGESIRLWAWHPLFEETLINLVVPPHDTKAVHIELRPASKAATGKAATSRRALGATAASPAQGAPAGSAAQPVTKTAAPSPGQR